MRSCLQTLTWIESECLKCIRIVQAAKTDLRVLRSSLSMAEFIADGIVSNEGIDGGMLINESTDDGDSKVSSYPLSSFQMEFVDGGIVVDKHNDIIGDRIIIDEGVDGRLLTDLTAESLGIYSVISAFLDPQLKKADPVTGVSFSSSALIDDNLHDQYMAFGSDQVHFTDTKRCVVTKNLGPNVSSVILQFIIYLRIATESCLHRCGVAKKKNYRPEPKPPDP